MSQDDDRIWIEQVPKGVFADMGERPERTELVHHREDMLIPLEADRGCTCRTRSWATTAPAAPCTCTSAARSVARAPD